MWLNNNNNNDSHNSSGSWVLLYLVFLINLIGLRRKRICGWVCEGLCKDLLMGERQALSVASPSWGLWAKMQKNQGREKVSMSGHSLGLSPSVSVSASCLCHYLCLRMSLCISLYLYLYVCLSFSSFSLSFSVFLMPWDEHCQSHAATIILCLTLGPEATQPRTMD